MSEKFNFNTAIGNTNSDISAIREGFYRDKNGCIVRSLHPDTKDLDLKELNKKVTVYTDAEGNIVAGYKDE